MGAQKIKMCYFLFSELKKKLQVIVNGAQFARQLGIICPLECSCFLSAGNPGL